MVLPVENPAAGPVGATMVIPSDVKRVVESLEGQEVVSQLRPVRQHPPRYTAEQA